MDKANKSQIPAGSEPAYYKALPGGKGRGGEGRGKGKGSPGGIKIDQGGRTVIRCLKRFFWIQKPPKEKRKNTLGIVKKKKGGYGMILIFTNFIWERGGRGKKSTVTFPTALTFFKERKEGGEGRRGKREVVRVPCSGPRS